MLEISEFNGTFVRVMGLSTVGALIVFALMVSVCLVSSRLSPLAPGLCAVVLIGWTVLYVLAPETATGFVPQVALLDSVVQLVALGLYLPLATVLFVPVVLPSRWRRGELGGEQEYLDDLYEDYDGPAQDREEPRQGQNYAGRRRAHP